MYVLLILAFLFVQINSLGSAKVFTNKLEKVVQYKEDLNYSQGKRSLSDEILKPNVVLNQEPIESIS